MSQSMNILVTSAGRRVSLIRSFQTELKKFNPEGKVYAIDASPQLSAACLIADQYFKAPPLDDPSYMDFLLELCKTHAIKIIIPTIDTELLELSAHKLLFAKNNIEIVISDYNFVEICRNKRLSHLFFNERNIPTAKEFPKNSYNLPIFVKPVNGSRSIDTSIIESEEDFRESQFKDENLMFLEYIDDLEYDEYTCDLYYDLNSELKCVVPRKRIEVREGEVYKALTCNNTLVPYIKRNLKHIDGAIGCLTAQFFMHKLDTSKIIGIEINPRFGGGYPLTYLSGANFSKWIIEEYIFGNKIDEQFDVWEDELLMVRYDDEILVHGYKSC